MIRKFEVSDTEQIINIWLNGNIETHSFIPPVYWKKNVSVLKQQLPSAEIYVYEEDDVLKGFIGLKGDYVAGIFVAKIFRSMGVGRALLKYAGQFHRCLFLNVYVKNEQAVRFYQREGFKIVSEKTDKNTGEAEYTMLWNAAG